MEHKWHHNRGITLQESAFELRAVLVWRKLSLELQNVWVCRGVIPRVAPATQSTHRNCYTPCALEGSRGLLAVGHSANWHGVINILSKVNTGALRGKLTHMEKDAHMQNVNIKHSHTFIWLFTHCNLTEVHFLCVSHLKALVLHQYFTHTSHIHLLYSSFSHS